MTDTEYFQAVYEKVLEQLSEKRAYKDELETKLDETKSEIVQLEQLLNAAAPFVSAAKIKVFTVPIVDDVKNLSLTEAVRKVLKQSKEYRTARGVRDSLQASGYDLKGQHNNPLASIHGVLKRLSDSGEVEQAEINGKTRFRWKGLTETDIKKLRGFSTRR